MPTFVFVTPEVLGTVSADLNAIGSAISSANGTAARSTTSALAAAQDEVSVAISRVFEDYAGEYQALSGQAALFHERFVQTLTSGAGLYATAEAASADPLTALVGELQGLGLFNFDPIKLLTGRPLFGNGADGAPGTGQAGADGGWLIGNGGNGGNATPSGSAVTKAGHGGNGGAAGAGANGGSGGDGGSATSNNNAYGGHGGTGADGGT
ncbi:PE family protein, partial [Mycobacterium intermedium]|uniref:PE family protein n=1 Tax=Mycobacterium intermedium TaxID=28445 RepID=UPI0039EAA32B